MRASGAFGYAYIVEVAEKFAQDVDGDIAQRQSAGREPCMEFVYVTAIGLAGVFLPCLSPRRDRHRSHLVCAVCQ